MEDALVGLCGRDVVNANCQNLGDGTDGLYPPKGVVVHEVEFGEELEPLRVRGTIVSGFLPFSHGIRVGGI